jgi:hypothetical protein
MQPLSKGPFTSHTVKVFASSPGFPPTIRHKACWTRVLRAFAQKTSLFICQKDVSFSALFSTLLQTGMLSKKSVETL